MLWLVQAFLKALQDIPQYVCTCCHQLLFCQNVQPFHIDHYDLSNSIVAKSLSHHYTMNIMGPVTTHEALVDQHSQWPHIPCHSQIENTSGVSISAHVARIVYRKKFIYAGPSLCKWLTHSNHTPKTTGHHPIRKMNNFSTYSIFDSVNHEKIWWPLPCQWTMCVCANNI